jgi:hypothetical protein
LVDAFPIQSAILAIEQLKSAQHLTSTWIWSAMLLSFVVARRPKSDSVAVAAQRQRPKSLPRTLSDRLLDGYA